MSRIEVISDYNAYVYSATGKEKHLEFLDDLITDLEQNPLNDELELHLKIKKD